MFLFCMYDFDNLVHLYMMGLLTNNDVQLMLFNCFDVIVFLPPCFIFLCGLMTLLSGTHCPVAAMEFT